ETSDCARRWKIAGRRNTVCCPITGFISTKVRTGETVNKLPWMAALLAAALAQPLTAVNEAHAGPPMAQAPAPKPNPVDACVQPLLQKRGIEPAELCSDEVF